MNLPDVRGFVNVGKSFVKANRPEILLGASIAATAVSVVGAAIGGYRSGKQVAEISRKTVPRLSPRPRSSPTPGRTMFLLPELLSGLWLRPWVCTSCMFRRRRL
jgi:hypothetical protein